MRTKTRQVISRLIRRLGDRRGVTLVELIMALAIISLVAASFVPGLGLGSTAASRASQETVAQNLARRQTEYVKTYTYNELATTYPLVSALANYAITVTVESVPGTGSDIQQVTVSVAFKGDNVVTAESFKVNR
jgi:prepilin-type N-terminal cleavage/methylation domain-containing protein